MQVLKPKFHQKQVLKQMRHPIVKNLRNFQVLTQKNKLDGLKVELATEYSIKNAKIEEI